MIDKNNFVKNLDEFVNGEIILINKQQNWTSFDVVNKIRSLLFRALNKKRLKVGHAGTLDPLATGLLIVATGKMTKSLSEYQNLTKEYITTFRFGNETPSFDRETEVVKECDIEYVTERKLKQLIKEKFIGEIMQEPPLYSAIKIDGKKAYQLARKGKEKKLEPRKIIIYEMDILAFNLPDITFRIKCSAGTYIRSIARDLGKELRSCAYMTELKRTCIGEYTVNDALTIGDFQNKIINLENKYS